jgi:three-Cys-motif partner protein
MSDDSQGKLFSGLPAAGAKPITFKRPQRPLWTENKAKLIQKYLYYFVMITRSGCYIDGFAGPQRKDSHASWAARLVLESQPKWLREFWLCDVQEKKVDLIKEMVGRQDRVPGRRIHVVAGDFNKKIDEVLANCRIRDGTASFCLLDQHTFECEWQTLQKVAQFKKAGLKIELLYFLATGWLERSMRGTTRNTDVIARWWGRDDWPKLSAMDGWSRALLLAERFKTELGYEHVIPWPIHKRGRSRGRVMFHMVHATDHPMGPPLMARAFANATKPNEPASELQMDFRLLGGLGTKPAKG